MWSEDPTESDQDYLSTFVQVFRREVTGWELAAGEGGGSWEGPNLWMPPLPTDVVLFGGVSCSGTENWWCCAVYGFAGGNTAFVEVEGTDGADRHPADLVLSTFVAAFDGRKPATVRTLDSSGTVLSERSFDAVRPT
jgi:hypothetical protein